MHKAFSFLQFPTITVSGLGNGTICWHRGRTQGSTLQQRTNKTLTTDPFGNTCEADEVSPDVEAWGIAGIKCLQTSRDTDL
jgi:hypothetical protein